MFYDNAWSIQQKCRMGGTDMCVGLSAKVVKISDGTAVVDAGGAKREFPPSSWETWSRGIM